MTLETIVQKLSPIEARINEPIQKYTTFKVGGPVDLFVIVKNRNELQSALQIITQAGLAWMVIGKGSNLLITDDGLEGAVVFLDGEFKSNRISEKNMLYCGAGMELSEVSELAFHHGYTGSEFAIGIPGSFGGGVFMNAGAYDGEVSSIIHEVEWMSESGEIQNFSNEHCCFEYRKSFFQKKKGVILGATLSLYPGNPDEIKLKMDDLTEKRNTKQPLDWPSAGSTFKRPPGYFAGTLIQEAGLKGFVLGGAQVSEKHAGFVINANEAKAEDILNLMDHIRKQVFEYAQVWLVPEVRILGRSSEKWQFLYQF